MGRNDRRVLMGTSDGYLIAVNADTGKPIESFGVNGKADLYPAIPRATRHSVKMWSGGSQYVSPNSPPVVVRDTVIVGAAMSDRRRRRSGRPATCRPFDAAAETEVGVPSHSRRRRVRCRTRGRTARTTTPATPTCGR
jgi:quinoprotein glucose dehydrogenase